MPFLLDRFVLATWRCNESLGGDTVGKEGNHRILSEKAHQISWTDPRWCAGVVRRSRDKSVRRLFERDVKCSPSVGRLIDWSIDWLICCTFVDTGLLAGWRWCIFASADSTFWMQRMSWRNDGINYCLSFIHWGIFLAYPVKCILKL